MPRPIDPLWMTPYKVYLSPGSWEIIKNLDACAVTNFETPWGSIFCLKTYSLGADKKIFEAVQYQDSCRILVALQETSLSPGNVTWINSSLWDIRKKSKPSAD